MSVNPYSSVGITEYSIAKLNRYGNLGSEGKELLIRGSNVFNKISTILTISPIWGVTTTIGDR